jgi:DNA-binding NtrC family response regulator
MLPVAGRAEENELIATSLRSYYPECRIEAVASTDEVVERASKLKWHVIFLGEWVPCRHDHKVLQQVRRQAPRAGILVQTAQRYPHVALEVMRHGDDYCFFAQPSTLLEQLPMLIKEMLEKHERRVNLDPHWIAIIISPRVWRKRSMNWMPKVAFSL